MSLNSLNYLFFRKKLEFVIINNKKMEKILFSSYLNKMKSFSKILYACKKYSTQNNINKILLPINFFLSGPILDKVQKIF